ncbi:cysteine repeat modular protein A-like isoform X1 [Oculina patagonica]
MPDCKIYLNPLNSDKDIIIVPATQPNSKREYIRALLASGFQLLPRQDVSERDRLLSCPVGTFINSSSEGAEGCIKCPPGGFYSDDVAYVGKSCKTCPTGSFVPFDRAPGTQIHDCKTCPLGTETDLFAGFRACNCLEGHYRTHMFEGCHECEQGGLKCKDEHVTLKTGYWWEWRNETHKQRYQDYIKNLLAPLPELDVISVQYPYPIPKPYMCPREHSCKGSIGLLDSLCETGYTGPLCAVCSSGYYKQLQTCKKCPSKKWISGQLCIIVAILSIIIAVSVWTSKRKKNTRKAEGFQLLDLIFSKLKIVIGFYQVTYGLLDAFSYIRWPDSLNVVAKYSEILQINLLQVAPVHCLFPKLHVDAFGSLFAIMAVNAALIAFSWVAYGVFKAIVLKSKGMEDNGKLRKISQAKEVVFKNLFFFLYVTYLSTCYKTANVLPLACWELCRDEREELCYKYLKADYSIQCQGAKYNHLLIGAYISTTYILALPVASIIALWKQRKALSVRSEDGTSKESVLNMEVTSDLRFLVENYKTRTWYWEMVEMSRKVILTSGLILVGQESRSYIGLTLVIAGLYGMLFSWMKPIKDVTENTLMSMSLAVTVFNLAVGAVSRIPAENLPASKNPYMDAVFFKILILGANTLVISLLVVQYAVQFHGYLKKWRKNPHWSWSCCLALLLPINDLQGEIRGLGEMNVLTNQLQTGSVDMPTIQSSLKDSQAFDVSLRKSEQDDDKSRKGYDVDCLDSAHSNKRRHQETQTEPFTLSAADVRKLVYDKHL